MAAPATTSCSAPQGPNDLEGGAGNDYVDGEQAATRSRVASGGRPTLGDKGNDQINGDEGNDRVEAARRRHRLNGGGGTDVGLRRPGSDDVEGGAGDGDIVRGDAGTDVLAAAKGTMTSSPTPAPPAKGSRSTSPPTSPKRRPRSAQRLRGRGRISQPTRSSAMARKQDSTVASQRPLESGGGGGEAFGAPGSDECTGFTSKKLLWPGSRPPPGGAYVPQRRARRIQPRSPGPARAPTTCGSPSRRRLDRLRQRAIFGRRRLHQSPRQRQLVTAAAPPRWRLVTVTGGDGNDNIVIDPASANSHVRINGNAGSDTLVGGSGDDVLEPARTTTARQRQRHARRQRRSDVLYADPGGDMPRAAPGTTCSSLGRRLPGPHL